LDNGSPPSPSRTRCRNSPPLHSLPDGLPLHILACWNCRWWNTCLTCTERPPPCQTMCRFHQTLC
jgi:hypothetical protein